MSRTTVRVIEAQIRFLERLKEVISRPEIAKLLRKRDRPKNPAAVSLGRKGGEARLKSMTPDERRESARKAGIASGRARKKKP